MHPHFKKLVNAHVMILRRNKCTVFVVVLRKGPYLELIRCHPHDSGHFWNRIFCYSDSCGRGHKPLVFKKMRFQWADSLVSCGRKVALCEKKGGVKNIQILVDVVWYHMLPTTCLQGKHGFLTNHHFFLEWFATLECATVLALITSHCAYKSNSPYNLTPLLLSK